MQWGKLDMNQCQGCQAGWRLKEHKLRPKGSQFIYFHEVEGGYEGEMVVCTKKRYNNDSTPPEVQEDVVEGKCPQDKIETVRSWMLDINMAANLVEAKKDEEDREALLHNIRELAGQSRRLLDAV